MKTKPTPLFMILFLSLFLSSCVEEDTADDCTPDSSSTSIEPCSDGGIGNDNDSPEEPLPDEEEPDKTMIKTTRMIKMTKYEEITLTPPGIETIQPLSSTPMSSTRSTGTKWPPTKKWPGLYTAQALG